MNTYLFKDYNYYKIGKSKNVENRFRELEKYNPTLSVVSFVDKDIENYLHRKFKDKRVKNEWFCLNDNEEQDVLREFGNPNINDIPYKDYVIDSGMYEGRFLISMRSDSEIAWLRSNINNRAFYYWQKYYLRFCNIIDIHNYISTPLTYSNLNFEEEKIVLIDLLKKHPLVTIQEYSNMNNITYNGTKSRIKSGKINTVYIGKTAYIMD